METAIWTCVHVFGSHAWRPPTKMRGKREYVGSNMLLALFLMPTPITTSYDWKMPLNLNTSTTREGWVISQTILKRRDHKPNKHMNIGILFKSPNSDAYTHTQINASIHLLYISGFFAWELSGLWQVHLHKKIHIYVDVIVAPLIQKGAHL